MENMEENVSWIEKRFVKFRRNVSWIVKRYEKYGRKLSWKVKRYGKYGGKWWKVLENADEMSVE